MEIKTKYNIGDTVFFMSYNKIKTDVIQEANINIKTNETGERHVTITYTLEKSSAEHISIDAFYEYELFATKEELINSL